MQVTSLDDRGAAAFLIQLFIRPFANQLTKIKKLYDPGSPRLNPPKSVYKTCDVQERRVEDIWIYDITRKKPSNFDTGKKTKRIYYIAGGSWQTPPTGDHFKLLARLVERLSQPAIISLISCPLAPKSPAPDTFPALCKMYDALLGLPSFECEDICFAGDSSGGNLALCLTLHCCMQPDARAPHSLLLLCPTVDLLHEHPDLKELEKLDPIESLKLVKKTADAWAGIWDKHDPRLSPVLGTVKVLADHNVRVNGIIAGYDVLSREARTFLEKCQEFDVDGRFLIWERQMHNFPIMAPYKISEAKRAVDWMVDALEEGRRDAEKPGDMKHEKLQPTSTDMDFPVRDAHTLKHDADKIARHKRMKTADGPAVHKETHLDFARKLCS